jgi:hypothetical protein
MKNQAEKYGDICLLLEASKPRDKNIQRKEKGLSTGTESGGPELEETPNSDSGIEKKHKHRKLGPRDIAYPPPRSKEAIGTTQPSSGAGGAGGTGGLCWFNGK